MQQVLNCLEKKVVTDVLKTLSEIERLAIVSSCSDKWATLDFIWALCYSPEARFGSLSDYRLAIERTRIDLNYSQKYIKDIEAKALRKLRHPSRMRRLNNVLVAILSRPSTED